MARLLVPHWIIVNTVEPSHVVYNTVDEVRWSIFLTHNRNWLVDPGSDSGEQTSKSMSQNNQKVLITPRSPPSGRHQFHLKTKYQGSVIDSVQGSGFKQRTSAGKRRGWSGGRRDRSNWFQRGAEQGVGDAWSAQCLTALSLSLSLTCQEATGRQHERCHVGLASSREKWIRSRRSSTSLLYQSPSIP